MVKSLALALSVLALLLIGWLLRPEGGGAATAAKQPSAPSGASSATRPAEPIPMANAGARASPTTEPRTPIALAGEAREEPTAQEASAVASRLEIEVVDALEQPLAGVPVSLLMMDGVEYEEIWWGSTHEGGRVVLELDGILAEHVEHGIHEFFVGPSTAPATPTHVSFRHDAPPGDLLRFHLAPTCDIEVVLVDPRGQPMPVPASVWLHFPSRSETPLPPALQSSWLNEYAQSGRARFEGVGLALPLRAGASSERYRFGEQSVRSPDRSGELLHIELTLESVPTLVVGRLVDFSGAAVGEEDLHLSLVHRDPEEGMRRESTVGRTATNAEGRFEVPAGHLRSSGSSIGDEYTALVQASRTPQLAGVGFVRWVETDDADFDRIVIDLGDIRVEPLEPIEPLPLLVAGRVLDPAGDPVDFVRPSIRPLAPAELTRWWTSEEPSRPDGRFEIRGRVDWTRVAVRASHSNLALGEPVEVEVGDQDVTLVLDHPGRVVGQVLLPQGLVMDDLDFSAARTAPNSEARVTSWDCTDDGRFVLERLGAGLWRITLSFEGTVLATWSDVLVSARKLTRLETRDLG